MSYNDNWYQSTTNTTDVDGTNTTNNKNNFSEQNLNSEFVDSFVPDDSSNINRVPPGYGQFDPSWQSDNFNNASISQNQNNKVWISKQDLEIISQCNRESIYYRSKF